MTLYKWSQTAASDATADPTINWAEGQAPSSVNDSARGMMAAISKYRDDTAGAIVTGGTSTAYTVTSFEGFDTLAHLSGQVIAFTPHTTNGAGPVMLNVDSLGAKPLRTSPNADLLAGTVIQGTPYVAIYNNSDSAFYLQGFYGNPFSIPLGSMIDFIGTTAPNSSFVLPFGQTLSQSVYTTLFAMVGTTYNTGGEAAGTFRIPDLRGRVVAGKDDMGGSAAGIIGSVSTDNGTIVGATLGSKGGTAIHVLTTSEMPTHSHGVIDPGHAHQFLDSTNNPTVPDIKNVSGGTSDFTTTGGSGRSAYHIGSATTGISINNSGSGSAHAILQPTIIANKLLRVI